MWKEFWNTTKRKRQQWTRRVKCFIYKPKLVWRVWLGVVDWIRPQYRHTIDWTQRHDNSQIYQEFKERAKEDVEFDPEDAFKAHLIEELVVESMEAEMFIGVWKGFATKQEKVAWERNKKLREKKIEEILND